MGNKNCDSLRQDILQSQAYGEFQIIREGNKNYAKIIKVIDLQSSLKKSIVASLTKRSNLKLEGLCQLLSFDIQQSENIIQIVMKYEYFPNTLFQKKQQLFEKNQFFPLDELMKIINQVSKTLEQLHKNNIKHGCINLNTILCSQTGYKLTDISSTSYASSLQLVQRGLRNQPISQKIVNFVNQGSIKKLIKKQITLDDDLFSLGMVVLSLGAKIQISQFYKFQMQEKKLHIQLNYLVIDDYLYLLRKRYSKNFEKTVRKLLFTLKECSQQYFSRLAIEKKDKVDIETNPNSINYQDY